MIYFSEFILFGNYSKVMLILVTVHIFSLKVRRGTVVKWPL